MYKSKSVLSKMFFLGLISAILPMSFAHAGHTDGTAAMSKEEFSKLPMVPGLPEGNYIGFNRGTRSGIVHLMVRPVVGCAGCFIAVKYENGRSIRAYYGLPQEEKNINGMKTSPKYTLTPLGVDPDGELGMVGSNPNAPDNPAYSLSIDSNIGTQHAKFVLIQAGGGNTVGTQNSMTFNGCASPFRDVDSKGGRYDTPPGLRTSGTISMEPSSESDGSHEATLNWLGDSHNNGGSYMLYERAPLVYTTRPESYLATGAQVSPVTNKIVFFIKWLGLPTHALLINPNNENDITYLRVKF